ncbi:T9SS type A sorting domain-containing protein [bacterium]|nr:MAG: T9SS type A sorting domain-containing protein [bacterium]
MKITSTIKSILLFCLIPIMGYAQADSIGVPIQVPVLPIVSEGDSVRIPLEFIGPIPIDSALTSIEFNFFWNPQSGLNWQNEISDLFTSELTNWEFAVQKVNEANGEKLKISMNAPEGQSYQSELMHIRLLELKAIISKDENHEPIELYIDSLKLTAINNVSFEESSAIKVGVIHDKNDTNTPPPTSGSQFFISKPDFVVGNHVFPLMIKGLVKVDSAITGFRFKFDWEKKDLFDISDFQLTNFTSGWDIQIVEIDGVDQITIKTNSPISLKDTAVAFIELSATVMQPEFDTDFAFYVEDIEIEKGGSFMIMSEGKFEIGRSKIFGMSSGGGGSTGSTSPYSGFIPLLPTDSGRVNNGLYGGRPLDFAWDEVNNQVYITMEAASSVYVSSDTGRTWTSPFPVDSLEWFEGFERRGWGGRGVRVVANGGYVYTVTVEEAGTLNSTQVKRPGTDFTTLLHQSEAKSIVGSIDPSISANFNIIDAKGSHVIVGSDKYLLRSDDGGYMWTVTLVPDDSLYSNYSLTKVGLLSDTTSNFIVIAQQNFGSHLSHLLKTNDGGLSFNTITPIDTDTLSIEAFVIHPTHTDTLFVTARNADTSPNGIWKTVDGGANWTKVKDVTGSAIDYQPMPQLFMYETHGKTQLLVVPGAGNNEYSEDLGTSFNPINAQNDPVSNVVTANAVGHLHIPNTDIYFGDGDNAPTRSTGGLHGTYIPVPEGLEGVNVWQIAQSPGVLDTVYLATTSGIGYTTAYTRTDIPNTAKWAPPYGKFPINPNNGGNVGFTSIQVNENDPNHVIGANGNGIFVSFTGGTTNDAWQGTDFTSISGLDIDKVKNDGGNVSDIVFVNADTVYAALRASRTLYGALLASYDGGVNWSLHSGVANNHSYNALKKASQGSTTYLYMATGGTFDTSTIDSGAVYRSTDHGKTWSKRGFMVDAEFNPLGFPMPINDLEAVPSSLDTLYFAAGSNLSNVVAATYDGGLTFTPLFGGYEGAFEAVAVNKHNPDSVYFAVRRNIFVYDAASASTELLFRGFPGELTHDLLYDALTQGSSGGFFNIKKPKKSGTSTSIEDWADSKPNEIELFQNYPNPFNPSTTISFKLPASSTVELHVYNVIGQRVATLVNNQNLNTGFHQIQFDASRLSSGVYFYTLRAGTFNTTKKMLLIK